MDAEDQCEESPQCTRVTGTCSEQPMGSGGKEGDKLSAISLHLNSISVLGKLLLYHKVALPFLDHPRSPEPGYSKTIRLPIL